MGGNTGNIRTQRLSASSGTRTFTSMIADAASAGAGSCRRTLAWYIRNGYVNPNAEIFDIRYGQFRNRTEWFLKGTR